MQKIHSKDDAKSATSKRRGLQNSIDLQDYLNFSSGVDNKRVAAPRIRKAESTTKREQTAQHSSRGKLEDNQNLREVAVRTPILFDKISKNKYITENDIEKEKREEGERRRVEKLKEIDAVLIQQSESML